MSQNFTNDETTTQAIITTTPSETSLGLAIGLPCAAITLLLIAVFVFVYQRKKLKRRKLKKKKSRNGNHSSLYASIIGPVLPERPPHLQRNDPLLTYSSSGATKPTPSSSPPTNQRYQNQRQIQAIGNNNEEKKVTTVNQGAPCLNPSPSPKLQHNLRAADTENEYITPATTPKQVPYHRQDTDYLKPIPEDPYLPLDNIAEPELEPKSEEQKFFPATSVAINMTIIDGLGEPPTPTAVDMHPCLNPIRCDMKELDERLLTFAGQMTWPQYKFHATTQEFAMAGLYYLGSADKTCCWYCGGTFERWCNDDIPWEEHARWYPRCEYLLRCKGSDFVRKTQEKYESV